MIDDHRLRGIHSCCRETLAENPSFASMDFFVDAIVRIEDGRKVWERGVAGGLLSIPALAI